MTPSARPALLAAGLLGSVHAAFSLYWGLGGTWLVRTLGNRMVDAFAGWEWLLVQNCGRTTVVGPAGSSYGRSSTTSCDDRRMDVELSALAINVAIPEDLRWRDSRRDEEFELQSLTIRMLPDGSLAAKAYGKPVAGGRGAYTSFPVPDRPELAALVSAAAAEAARRWGAHS